MRKIPQLLSIKRIFTEYIHEVKTFESSQNISANSWILDEVCKNMMRLRHNEVNFDITEDDHQNHKICLLAIRKTFIHDFKIYLIMFEPHRAMLFFYEPYP